MAGYIGSRAVSLSTTSADVAGDAVIDGNLTVKGTTVTIDSSQAQEIRLGDNDKMTFGDATGGDLQIYHDGSESIIKDAGTGNLKILASNLRINNADSSKSYITGVDGGYVNLYYNGSQKLVTTNTGIDVTGTVTADGLTVDGTPVRFNSTAPMLYFMEAGVTDSNHRIRQNAGNLYFQKLSDDEATSTNRMLIDGGTGDISFYEDTGTTPKFFWDASAESLGIGTSSPSHLIDGRLSGTLSGEVISVGNVTTGSFGGIAISDGGTYPVRHWGSSLEFYTGNSTYSSATERMRIDSSGNVGIGNTSSGYVLTSGETRLAVGDGSEHAAIQIYSGTGKWGAIDFADDATNGAGQGFIGYYHPSDYMQFSTSGSEAMRIDSSGRVGIGTTSPELKLDVAGDILINNNSYLYGENSVGSNSKLIGRASNDTLYIGDSAYANPTIIQTGNNYVGFATNGSERMRIDSSGNVGIGTTPNYVLDVRANGGGSSKSILLENTGTDSGDSAILRIKTNNGSNGYIFFSDPEDSNAGEIRYSHASDFMSFDTNGAERMRITSTGSVCVNGTSTSFGFFQVNQPTNNDENGIGIVSSAAGRSMRLWVDESVSYINSGNGGSGRLHLNQGGGAITMGTHDNLEVNPNPSSSLSAVYIRSGEGTNSGSSSDLTSGTQLLRIEGDSDSLQVRNVGTGDYSIVNGQQSNGIVMFDGSGGLGFYFNNSEKAEVTSSGFSTVSDERLKDQQGDIDVDAISVFNSLNLFKYHPKARADDASGDTDTMMYGFSAQQLNQLAPHAVNDGVDDLSDDPKKPWYSVSDTSLKALMIQAIKTLSAENEAMKARLDALEAN